MTDDKLVISKNGLWTNNVALVQLLGLCPLLAVTGTFAGLVSVSEVDGRACGYQDSSVWEPLLGLGVCRLRLRLLDLKGRDLVTLPVAELTDITDYMILASGTSNRHVKSLVDKLAELESASQATANRSAIRRPLGALTAQAPRPDRPT